MPNTPALVGKGVTGLAAAGSASQAAVDAAKALFEAVGSVLVIPETQIDALSAVSGSGPAWVYYIIEQWEKGFDVVYGQRVKREAPLHMQLAYKAFYRVFSNMASVPVPALPLRYSRVHWPPFSAAVECKSPDLPAP